MKTLSLEFGNAALEFPCPLWRSTAKTIRGRHPVASLHYPRHVARLPENLRPIPLGRHKLPRNVVEEHQRARVLEAAIETFAEHGYPATTVDDLVAAAKVGVGSFYAHFEGKEQCLLGAFDRIVAEGTSRVAGAASEGATWADAVCLGLRALLTAIAAEPASARIALVEIQTGGPAALARYGETLATVAQALVRGRQELAPDRRLPDSLEQTTVSGIAWLLHRRLAVGEAASVPGLFGELAVLILEPYLGDERAQAAVEQSALAPSA
jgi:AcrR family transcriptional regulator